MQRSPDDHQDSEAPLTRAHQAADAGALAPARNGDSEGPSGEVTRRQVPVGETEAEAEPVEVPLPPANGVGSPSSGGPTPSNGVPPPRGVDGKVEPGQLLYTKYHVVKRLGRGAMGDVWLVRHAAMEDLHALKLIVANIATNKVALIRFQREFKVMASLKHPHAVQIYDARIDDDGGYIDMEYVRGQTLHELLVAARLRPDLDPSAPLMPLSWVLRILDQLTEVLQEAHEMRIVHRDLKPANLMLLEGKKPGKEYLKVLDFGIAKIRDDPDNAANNLNLTQGGFLGTPCYGSPEQTINPRAIDGRADLYSVGVMLYEFATGQLPFRGAGYVVMHQHANMPAPSFHEINPQLRPLPELERVILRILAKDPAQRPQTARELYDEVEQAIEDILGPAALRRTPPSSEALRIAGPIPAPLTDPMTETDGGPRAAVLSTGPDTLWVASNRPRPSKTQADAVADFEDTAYRLARPRLRLLLGLIGSIAAALAVGVGIYLLRSREILPPHRCFLPEGYVAVADEAQPGTCPRTVRRKSDQVLFTRHADGIYLPSDYLPVGEDQVDGWPRVITLDGEETHARFIRIKGNKEWTRGAYDAAPDSRRKDAPSHQVLIRSGFYIQETEVTNGQYEDYLKKTDHVPTGEWEQMYSEKKLQGVDQARKHPVANIKRTQAIEFARAYAAMLPTEAQWEYAARSQGERRKFVWGKEYPSRQLANIDRQDTQTTAPVGSYPRDVTEQGVVDLMGNVREMCRDIGKPYRMAGFVLIDPCEDVADPGREILEYVIRGGDFHSTPDDCSTTRRDDRRPGGDFAENLGFRLVIECPDARPSGRSR